jgi:PPOX class probable FMN-dependent enzyme
MSVTEQHTDSYIVRTEVELRAIIGDEIPGLAEKNGDSLDNYAKEFIAKTSFLILATSDAQGAIDASPKGDAAGFVEVVDDRTLLIPDRPGNKLAYGHLNVLDNPRVGIIFIIPGTSETLRVNGRAELTANPEILERLAARGKPATLAIRVQIDEVFFHCAKAFIRSQLWKPEEWPEKHKVSFGEMYAARRGGDNDMARQIDGAVNADYEGNL